MATKAPPVVFATSYESLFRVLGPRLDAEAEKALLAQGVNAKSLNAAYPYDTWVASLRWAMKVLWPEASHDEATYRMGRAIFTSFADTLMGKALVPLLRLMGPKRGLERMARNLRTTNNYSEVKLTQRGPTDFELWINLVAFPHYFRGLLEVGLETSGAKDVQVEVASHHPERGLVLFISWK